MQPTTPDVSAKQERLDALKKESEKLLNDIKVIGKEDKEEQKVEAEKDSHLNDSERKTVNEFRKELKVCIDFRCMVYYSVLLINDDLNVRRMAKCY